MHPPLAVEPGRRYGRLVVIGEIESDLTGHYMRVRCDCGELKTVRLSAMTTGNTLSCGCLRRETSSRLGLEWNVKHRLSEHPLYKTWCDMVARCERPGHTSYRRYGARGIRVFERWHDVGAFIADIEATIGPRPDGMSLDRIDNDGNYEPGNVRWATWKQQARNTGRGWAAEYRRRAIVVLWCQGYRQRDMEEELGLPGQIVGSDLYRLRKAGVLPKGFMSDIPDEDVAARLREGKNRG